jgi:hypothetical protein
LIVDLPDETVQRIMVVLVGPALYQVLAGGERGFENDPEVNAYFDSFRLEP